MDELQEKMGEVKMLNFVKFSSLMHKPFSIRAFAPKEDRVLFT